VRVDGVDERQRHGVDALGGERCLEVPPEVRVLPVEAEPDSGNSIYKVDRDDDLTILRTAGEEDLTLDEAYSAESNDTVSRTIFKRTVSSRPAYTSSLSSLS